MLHSNQGGGQVTWMGQQEVKQNKETWSLVNTDAQGSGRPRTGHLLQPLCEHGHGEAVLSACFGCLSHLACPAGLFGFKGLSLVSVQAP